MEFSCFCKKNSLSKKKRLKSKLCRKDLLNLLNEPQQLTKNKPQKLRKIPNRGVTNLRERKLNGFLSVTQFIESQLGTLSLQS